MAQNSLMQGPLEINSPTAEARDQELAAKLVEQWNFLHPVAQAILVRVFLPRLINRLYLATLARAFYSTLARRFPLIAGL